MNFERTASESAKVNTLLRWGDIILMMGRHNFDVGATQLICWGDTTLMLGRRNFGWGDITWGEGNWATQPPYDKISLNYGADTNLSFIIAYEIPRLNLN